MRQQINTLKENLFRSITSFLWPDLRRGYSITSHLTLHERYQLFKLAKGKQSILEIGSYLGASAACFGAAAKLKKSAKVYCIDTWNNDAMTEGKRETFSIFLENTSPFKEHIVPVKGYSTDVVAQVANQTKHLDLLFIDGDHSYEGARADWQAYKGFLDEGSVVVFHDIGWAEGVVKVIEEDTRPYISSSGSLPNMWWGTIKKKP